jgi:hypothetical protein
MLCECPRCETILKIRDIGKSTSQLGLVVAFLVVIGAIFTGVFFVHYSQGKGVWTSLFYSIGGGFGFLGVMLVVTAPRWLQQVFRRCPRCGTRPCFKNFFSRVSACPKCGELIAEDYGGDCP